MDNHDYSSLLFLIAKLWAYIEIIRHEGLYVSLAKDKRGKQFQNFLDCLESRKVRLVDRISQRAVAELMLIRRNGGFETGTFIDFVHKIENNPELERWIKPIERVLSRTRHTSERQALLQYGIVVHAMIDTLDPLHEVTRDRPSYPEKLSKKTWRDLHYRVFGRYLRFVSRTTKYLGPPKT